MIAIRTKNLSPLFSDILGFKRFLKSLPDVSLVISPGDGVDWELSGGIPKGTTVYTLVPETKDFKEILDSHKLALGIFDTIPLFTKESALSGDVGSYFDYGLYGVEDINEVSEIEDKLGRLPKVIRVSVNPLKYPKEILDYCKAKGIQILGTDIFGERIFREYYRDLFPDSFLQAFGEHNTDILEVPGEDPYFIRKVSERFEDNQDSPKLLGYSKSVDKTPTLKTPPLRVYQTLDLNLGEIGDMTIQADKGKFSLKPVEEKFNLGDPLWEDDLIPEDIKKDDINLLGVLHRYHVLPVLQELHPPKVWKPVFTRIYPDFWAIKMIPKGFLGWLWKEHYYWMISGKLWKIPLTGHEILTNG